MSPKISCWAACRVRYQYIHAKSRLKAVPPFFLVCSGAIGWKRVIVGEKMRLNQQPNADESHV